MEKRSKSAEWMYVYVASKGGGRVPRGRVVVVWGGFVGTRVEEEELGGRGWLLRLERS